MKKMGLPDGGKGEAVNRRRPKPVELLEVHPRTVAFVLVEVVARPSSVDVDHVAVAGHLGGDGCGSNGMAQAIAVGDGGDGQAAFLQREIVDEQMLGLWGQAAHGPNHG